MGLDRWICRRELSRVRAKMARKSTAVATSACGENSKPNLRSNCMIFISSRLTSL